MPNSPESRDAITLLRNDHKEVEAIFKKCEKLMRGEQPSPELRELCMQAIQELTIHTAIEEQIFYPAMKQALGEDTKIIFESFEEHHVVKGVMHELRRMHTVDERFNAKLTVLMELVRHHVKEEEGELFPQCREICGRKLMKEIGATIVGFKKQLLKEPELQPRAEMPQPQNVEAIMQSAAESGQRH